MPRFRSQEIRLQAKNIPETIAFYRDVLGFTVDTTWGPDDDPEGCILDHGDVHLLFHREQTGEPHMTGVVVSADVRSLAGLQLGFPTRR